MGAFQRFSSGDEGSYERKFEQVIGNSPALESVLEQVERVAPTDSTVLIQGETGTGKELIAHAIHSLSARCGQPFVRLNCAAIPLDLLESELFGHEKGAFTGAIAQRIGRFEQADKGTLFLDEVGDIPPALQPKLLRVLQEHEFERLGSTRTHHVDVRLVAATNRNLMEMANRGEFRSDLYYRLNVFPVLLPPLRERREDIPALAAHFLARYAARYRRPIQGLEPAALQMMLHYGWPGNVRELDHTIERAVLMARGERIEAANLGLNTQRGGGGAQSMDDMSLEAVEAILIRKALARANGNVSHAADALGLSRGALYRRIEKYGL